jgi:hypothetical protein
MLCDIQREYLFCFAYCGFKISKMEVSTHADGGPHPSLRKHTDQIALPPINMHHQYKIILPTHKDFMFSVGIFRENIYYGLHYVNFKILRGKAC